VKTQDTGDIEKFSVKENFRKILNVSHFYLEFSCNKNYDKINDIEFSPFGLKKTNETL